MSQGRPAQPRRLIDEGAEGASLLAAARDATAEPRPGARERVWRALDEKRAGRGRKVLWTASLAAVGAAAAFAVVFLPRPAPPADSVPPAAVAEITGRVDVTLEGSAPIEAAVGAELPPRATIQVGEGGEAVVLVGPARAAVASGSRVELLPRGSKALLALDRGAVAVFARPQGTRSVTVIAAGPYLVEGSAALFLVRSIAGRVSVHVERGDVQVRTAAGNVPVATGSTWTSQGVQPAQPDDARLTSRAAGEAGPRASMEAPKQVEPPSAQAVQPPQALVAEPPAKKPARKVRVARAPRAGQPAPAPAIETDEALHARAHELERAGHYAEAAGAYAELSRRSGPRAEPALYELARVRARFLGQPQAALETLADYQRRYPNGALALEAALTTVEAQLASGAGDPALAAMDGFLDRFGDSERAPDVRWLRASLLAGRGECGRAQADLRALGAGGPRAADAVFTLASCARAQGDLGEARARIEEYLRRFPEGSRRAEAERALAGEAAQ